ncbi:MAG: hypothetical protein RLZZ232_3830 [Planctomycetota bacterium]|jgi:hypothetical protein
MTQIVPNSFLFQFSLQIPRVDAMPGGRGRLLKLPESSTLFVPARLNSEQMPMTVRMAWNQEGLGLEVRLRGKTQRAAGRWADLKHSDLVRVLLDMRPGTNVQRVTDYCVELVVLICDDDADDAATVRFTESGPQRPGRRALDSGKCRVERHLVADGYDLSLWVPGSQLPGYEQAVEAQVLGFYCIVEDTEIGPVPLSVLGDFPATWNPSLWIPLELKS